MVDLLPDVGLQDMRVVRQMVEQFRGGHAPVGDPEDRFQSLLHLGHSFPSAVVSRAVSVAAGAFPGPRRHQDDMCAAAKRKKNLLSSYDYHSRSASAAECLTAPQGRLR